jgi:hypothetical protein
MPETTTPIIAGTRIGHVHLKMADLDRALGFYSGVLGFEVMQPLGSDAAFISAGGYHHHIGLNTWESKGGRPPAPGTTGLFHTAILYPTRAALADALHRVTQREFLSTAPAITASAKPSICATPTRTASSCIGIGPRSNGRANRTDRWRCSPAASTSTTCCASARHDIEAPIRSSCPPPPRKSQACHLHFFRRCGRSAHGVQPCPSTTGLP